MTVTAQVGKLGALAPAKPRLIHEDVIDFLLVNPGITAKDTAKHFGMSYQWMLILTNSDAFQRRYEERRAEMLDPHIRSTLEDRMKGLVAQSVEVLMEKLQAAPDAKIALQALDIGAKALGYGAKPTIDARSQVTQFVVQVPPKSRDASEWAAQYGPSASLDGPTLPLPVRDEPPTLDLELNEEIIEASEVFLDAIRKEPPGPQSE